MYIMLSSLHTGCNNNHNTHIGQYSAKNMILYIVIVKCNGNFNRLLTERANHLKTKTPYDYCRNSST